MRENYRNFKTEKFTISIDFENTGEGSQWFSELYTESEHIAGTTIALDTRDGKRHFIGQYKPSDLASEYAKQGRENPSREAYESLEREINHYNEAVDFNLVVTVKAEGVELSECYGITTDVSSYSDDDWKKHCFRDYGRECLREAISEAREQLAKLKEIAA